ncbi:MAG: tyrosine-type recombinase/integrase [Acidimicrobiales bacterium]
MASSSEREWAEIAEAAPTLAATAAAYLDQIALSLRPGSVVVADSNLRLFCRYLLADHPDTRCFAAVGRAQVEGFKAWLGARMTPRGTAPSPNTRRHRLGMLRTFFDRIVEWDWPDAPARTPIFATDLARITPMAVRRWHADLSNAGVGAVTVAKSYRLLRTILGTAVADEVIVRNPCTVAGAGVERSPERPVATVAQVFELAAAVEPRHRALVLTAALSGCRWGELAGLTRRHLDLLHGTLTVAETLVEGGSGLSIGPPKTDAARRTVALPPPLVPILDEHLAKFSAPGRDGLVFCGPKGGMMRRGNFSAKDPGGSGDGYGGAAFPRPAAYGQHAGRGHRSEHSRAHAPDGACVLGCRPALPARHAGPRPGHRQGPRRPRERPRGNRHSDSLWHGYGTTGLRGLTSTSRSRPHTPADLRFYLERVTGIEPA